MLRQKTVGIAWFWPWHCFPPRWALQFYLWEFPVGKAGQGCPVAASGVCASTKPCRALQSDFHPQERKCGQLLLIPHAGVKERQITPIFLRLKENHSIAIWGEKGDLILIIKILLKILLICKCEGKDFHLSFPWQLTLDDAAFISPVLWGMRK